MSPESLHPRSHPQKPPSRLKRHIIEAIKSFYFKSHYNLQFGVPLVWILHCRELSSVQLSAPHRTIKVTPSPPLPDSSTYDSSLNIWPRIIIFGINVITSCLFYFFFSLSLSVAVYFYFFSADDFFALLVPVLKAELLLFSIIKFGSLYSPLGEDNSVKEISALNEVFGVCEGSFWFK